MAKKHGPWTIRESVERFHNDFITVREDQVTQPDGQPGAYATVALNAGVAVLPIDDDGTAYLVRQFRYAVGRTSLEAVSGSRDGDEPPQTAAERELREELGIEAADWIDLGSFDMDTSIIQAPVQLFVARQLTFTETEREGSETIETVKLPFNEVVRRVMDGTITHGPSYALVLKAQLMLRN